MSIIRNVPDVVAQRMLMFGNGTRDMVAVLFGANHAESNLQLDLNQKNASQETLTRLSVKR